MQQTDFITYLQKRIENSYNNVIVVVGKTGVGKSYLALKLGELIDTGFSTDNVAFSIKDFLDLIRMKPKGSVPIFDDAGIYFDAQKFYEKSQQLLSYALESCRFKYQTLIFTVPDFKMLNVNARRLTHFLILIKFRGIAQIKSLKYKSDGSTYLSTLRLDNLWFNSVEIGLPSKTLIKSYEQKKSGVLNKLYEKLNS
jgi:hypothetical protein